MHKVNVFARFLYYYCSFESVFFHRYLGFVLSRRQIVKIFQNATANVGNALCWSPAVTSCWDYYHVQISLAYNPR